MFRRLGAKVRHQEEGSVRFGSNLRALGNNVQVQPLHGAPQENNFHLQEVNEMLACLVQLKLNLETGGTIVAGSPFSVNIQKEVLPINMRQPHLEPYEGLTDVEDHLAYFLNTL